MGGGRCSEANSGVKEIEEMRGCGVSYFDRVDREGF